MSKPQSRPSVLTWIFAIAGLIAWLAGTLGYAPLMIVHPVAYVLILVAAVIAEPLVGRSGASNLQLGYAVAAWLMVALISVTEALPLGGILFFGFLALTMTFIYFHPSFRLKTRVTLYLVLLAIAWAPTIYGVVTPDEADNAFGAGARSALLGEAVAVSAIFFGFAIRWLAVERGRDD